MTSHSIVTLFRDYFFASVLGVSSFEGVVFHAPPGRHRLVDQSHKARDSCTSDFVFTCWNSLPLISLPFPAPPLIRTLKQAARLEDLSTQLRCSERKCNAQAKELSEARAEAKAARSELSRLARAKQTSIKKNSEERAAMAQTLRKRDSELANLREKIEAITGELSAEQEGTVSLRARLAASEREIRLTRERARVAEDNVASRASLDANAKSAALEERIAELETELKEQSAETERAKEEAKTATSELRTSEKEARGRAREASSSQDRLRVEKERSARVHLELQVRSQTEMLEVCLSDYQASDIRGDFCVMSTTVPPTLSTTHLCTVACLGVWCDVMSM